MLIGTRGGIPFKGVGGLYLGNREGLGIWELGVWVRNWGGCLGVFPNGLFRLAENRTAHFSDEGNKPACRQAGKQTFLNSF